MAHGAPDHTRLSDDAFSHYEYNYTSGGLWLIAPGDSRSIVDLDLVGVFGICYVLMDNKRSYFRVVIDGRKIFELSPQAVFEDLQLYGGKISGALGVSTYDDVNDKYSLWYHTDWKIYVHNHLKVDVYNFTISNCNVAAIWCEYAEYKG